LIFASRTSRSSETDRLAVVEALNGSALLLLSLRGTALLADSATARSLIPDRKRLETAVEVLLSTFVMKLEDIPGRFGSCCGNEFDDTEVLRATPRSPSGFVGFEGVVSFLCDVFLPIAAIFMPRTIEGGFLRGRGSSGVLGVIAPDLPGSNPTN
jgi:hypothetical protein